MSYFYFLLMLVIEVNAQTCPPGETWYKAHPRSAYVKADGTPYSAAFVTGHCRSKSKAHDFWMERLSNGEVEGWPHRSEKFKDWTAKELERTISTLRNIPDLLWKPIKIFRAEKSVTGGNTASSAPGVIVLYDKAFAQTELERYLSHELSHELYNSLSDFEKTAYRRF